VTNLYILRHASAGTKRVNPLLDINRPLDRDGKRHCLQLAHVLNAQKIQFDLIVSSPLKRSLQTASLVGTEMGYEAKILLSRGLEPSAKYADFQKLLHEVQSYENVMVVGHNPNLNQFLGALLVPAASGVTAGVRLRKGSIARLSMQSGPATLQWLLEPRMLRALYTTSTKSSRRKVSRK
jgi:phosphohistidine phosphatase